MDLKEARGSGFVLRFSKKALGEHHVNVSNIQFIAIVFENTLPPLPPRRYNTPLLPHGGARIPPSAKAYSDTVDAKAAVDDINRWLCARAVC